MKDIAKFATDTVAELDKLKGVKIERANLGPCPVCGRDVNENRKGYSCWSREDPGLRLRDLEEEGGQEPPGTVAKELMESLKASLERGDDPPIGRTEKQVTGFRAARGAASAPS